MPETPIHEVCHAMGSVYTLVAGELIQHPIMADGSYTLDPNDGGGAVDWERGVSDEEIPALRRIEANLKAREHLAQIEASLDEHERRIYREDARP